MDEAQRFVDMYRRVWFNREFPLARNRQLRNRWREQCETCRRPVLLAWGYAHWCSACLRFTSTTSILNAAGFCCCRCDCATEDISDSEDGDYNPEDDASGSSEGEQVSQGEAQDAMDLASDEDFSEHNAVGPDELRNLRTALSLDEVMNLDFVVLDHRLIREQFHEIDMIHDNEPADTEMLPYPNCPRCNRPLPDALNEAIHDEAVEICRQCARPLLARDAPRYSPLRAAELPYCRCRCDCNDSPCSSTCNHTGHNRRNLPTFRPYRGRSLNYPPSPWVRRILEQYGFCHRDRNEDMRVVNTIRPILPDPTLQEVLDEFLPEPDFSLLANPRLYGQGYDRLGEFPNGVRRSRNTRSGLPLPIERAFLAIDPDAFGQATRRRFMNDNFYAADPSSFIGNERLEYLHTRLTYFNRVRQEFPDEDISEIDLHCWIVLNEERLREDDDRNNDDVISQCSARDQGVSCEIYLEHLSAIGNYRASLDHTVRHLYVRYTRLLVLAGWHLNPDVCEDLENICRREALGYFEMH